MKLRGKTYARCRLIAKNVEGGGAAPPPPPPGLIRVKTSIDLDIISIYVIVNIMLSQSVSQTDQVNREQGGPAHRMIPVVHK